VTPSTSSPGSKSAGLAMAYKLIEAAQAAGAVNAPRLVALVRACARFERGQLVEREVATTRQPKRSSSTGLDYCSRPWAFGDCQVGAMMAPWLDGVVGRLWQAHSSSA
jgi:hypothetical protein